MERSFIVYLICGLAILGMVVLSILRKDTVVEYQKVFLNHEQAPLKYIPKKIFQLIPNKNNISSQFQWNINYLQNLNPDWEYHLLDDNDMINYIQRYYGDRYLSYYNRINKKYGAAKADFFRYLLMYREGGAYFDIKSACNIPLSKMLLPDDEYIISHWDLPIQKIYTKNDFGEMQQWHIICRPNHPFLAAVIENVMYNIDHYTVSQGVGKQAVLKVTGPIAYTKAIVPILDQYPRRVIQFNDLCGLVYNNLDQGHENLFSRVHYSKVKEPVIISN